MQSVYDKRDNSIKILMYSQTTTYTQTINSLLNL